MGACAAALAVLALCSCSHKPQYEEHIFSGETQGTTYTVRVVEASISTERVGLIEQAIASRLDLIDRLMSTYRPDSEISKFNASTETVAFAVSPEMIEVIQAAERVSRASGGAFDITVAPLVSAWGFGPDGVPQPPEGEELDKLRALVGYEKVETDPAAGTLRKTIPEVKIDLNGIAQGYTVDKVAADLDGLGTANYMVEIGGEVKARGHNARGIAWQIGVERPVAGAREIELVVPLRDTSISTSGDYRRYREENGVRISHTIDPRTGKSIAHTLASVTIVHPSCTVADGFCTAMMVLGPEAGYDLAQREGLAAMLVVHAGEGQFTERRTPAFEAALAGN